MIRVLVLMSLLLLPCTALAQEDTNGIYSEEAVVLAKLCVNEGSFFDPQEYNDCVAIYRVIRYRAENVYNRPDRLNRPVSFILAARIYSPRAFGIEPRIDTRHYIPHLRGDLVRPRSWPDTLDWEGEYQAKWQRILDHASMIVAGQVPDPCHHTPQHWGSIQDLRRRAWADRLDSGRWRVTECGRTMNYFLHPHPRRVRVVQNL